MLQEEELRSLQGDGSRYSSSSVVPVVDKSVAYSEKRKGRPKQNKKNPVNDAKIQNLRNRRGIV